MEMKAKKSCQNCPSPRLVPGNYIVDDDVVVSESEAAQDHAKLTADLDKLLGDKLNRLSIQERTLALHELHGVADDASQQKITSAMLRSKLKEVTDAIASSLGEVDTSAYQNALGADKEYVKRIILMCLQADCYDTKKVPTRVLSFFSFKQALFGVDKLAKDITQNDLEGADVAALRAGIVQLLPQRDQSGRTVIIINTPAGHLHSIESWSRVFYYVVMAALQDEATQNNGIVCVLYQVGQKHFRSRRPAKFAAVWGLVPLKLVAMHVCHDTDVGHQFAKAISQTMESRHLCRFRRHYGSFLECTYNLMTFGIPRSILPFQMPSGEADNHALHSWINSMECRETSCNHSQATASPASCRSSEIMVPGPMDIVMGRGSHARNTMGHFRFRSLLAEYRRKYDSAERHGKSKVVLQVLAKLRSSNCRFLKPIRAASSQHLLEECDDDETKEKIAHAFRNMRQQAKAKDDSDSSNSSKINPTTKKKRRAVESPPRRRKSSSPSPDRQ